MFILLAGTAWLLVSRLHRNANVLECIVLSVCLGLATVILIGCLIVVIHLPFWQAYELIIGCGVALLLVSLCTNHEISIRGLMGLQYSAYWLPVVLFVFHLTLWALYMNTYPYFSNTSDPDVLWHWQITNSILAGGNAGPVAVAGFPDGAHILFAVVSSYFQINVLTAMRIMAAFVESCSVLVAYCLFHRLLVSKLAADYASVAYAIIIPAGLVYYAGLGAYPNILGDFFVLMSFLVALLVPRNFSLRSVITVVLVDGVALVSHVSVVIFALLVIVYSPFVFWVYRSQLRDYLISNSGFFLFPAAAVLVASFLVKRVLNYISSLYFQIATNLMVYAQVWAHNFLALPGPLNFVLLLAGFLWALAKGRKSMWLMFVVAWFALLNGLVFFATFGDRLILLSFVPGAGLMGLILTEVHETIRRITLRRIAEPNLRRLFVIIAMVGLVLILAINGPGRMYVGQVLVSGQVAMQRGIYESMLWIGANTTLGSSVVSVGLWKWYRYLPLVTNRSWVGDFQLGPDQLLRMRTSLGFNYIVVSTSFTGLPTFYAADALHLAYENSNVAIFSVYSNA
jgi:hypothetical protein